MTRCSKSTSHLRLSTFTPQRKVFSTICTNKFTSAKGKAGKKPWEAPLEASQIDADHQCQSAETRGKYLYQERGSSTDIIGVRCVFLEVWLGYHFDSEVQRQWRVLMLWLCPVPAKAECCRCNCSMSWLEAEGKHSSRWALQVEEEQEEFRDQDQPLHQEPARWWNREG